ncbi:MAG TPA: type I-E CRISPR-associated protein Cas7/Cse4/CasC [Microvirga sp.]|jgi:CRISPR system Cascade subunit CasC|nr:type I-E CRISPR-associated protein Cas7/Cse4/CasC [Microvirga sp.]
MKLSIHILTALPPHNVNRDESGRPKTAEIGGVLRGRISSQARKRALRMSPHLDAGQRSIRTRELGIKVFRDLTADGEGSFKGHDVAAAYIALLVNYGIGADKVIPSVNDACRAVGEPEREPTKGKKKKSDASEDAEGEASGKGKAKTSEQAFAERVEAEAAAKRISPEEACVAVIEDNLKAKQSLVVSRIEFERAKEIVADARRKRAEGGDPDAIVGEVRDRVRDHGLLTDDDHDLDLGLFGRMVATAPGFTVEGAATVGHAFTVASFDTQADYFSAGEELNVLKGTGAAITDFAYFGTGTYYQHAVLDVATLRHNLSRGRDRAAAERLTTEAVELFVKGLIYSLPKGKRTGFASDVLPRYVLVRAAPDDEPVSNLGFAFFKPIEANGQDEIRLAIETLEAFDREQAKAYGLKGEALRFNAHHPARAGRNHPAEDETWDVSDVVAFARRMAA